MTASAAEPEPRLGAVATEETSFRSQVLISIQRALWQMVTPDLVAVAMGWRTGVVHARFVYVDPVGPDQHEIVSEVETYVIADFPADLRTDFIAVERTDSNSPHFEPGEEWWAYVRREPQMPNKPNSLVRNVVLSADREPFPVVFEMLANTVLLAPQESLRLVLRGPEGAEITVRYGENGVSVFRDLDLQVEV